MFTELDLDFRSASKKCILNIYIALYTRFTCLRFIFEQIDLLVMQKNLVIRDTCYEGFHSKVCPNVSKMLLV